MLWNEAINLLECKTGVLSFKEENDIIKLLKHGKHAMLALESLTPQGSEYYNDIETCVNYVKARRSGDVSFIAKKNNQVKDLKEKLKLK